MADSNDGFKEVTAENTPTWDRQAEIVGKLIGVKSNVGPNESMLYTLKTDAGVMGVWGSTVIDTKMQGVENGSMVKIVPMGEVKSEKTGRKYQEFKVFVKEPAFNEVGDDDSQAIDLDDIPM